MRAKIFTGVVTESTTAVLFHLISQIERQTDRQCMYREPKELQELEKQGRFIGLVLLLSFSTHIQSFKGLKAKDFKCV